MGPADAEVGESASRPRTESLGRPGRTALGSGHGEAQGARNRARRWRRQAPDAVDPRPRQTGGAVRRQLSADRLRAVQPRQRRLPPAVRADAVQVALARPAHLRDLADVDAARQLRDAGAGTAATRQAVVPRQRGRDLPVDEPHRRRETRHHRRVRRRPRLPDGCLADGRRRTSTRVRPRRWLGSGCPARTPTSSA